MFDFKNKVIVVTGAAGNLGRAVVYAYLHGSGIVCGLDNREDRLKSLFKEADWLGTFHPFMGVDVTDKKRMVALGKEISAAIGPVEVVVNTVGGFSTGEPVHELSAETWTQMMRLNVESHLSCAAAFVPVFIDHGRGKFISVGSRAALKGSAKVSAYSAAKSVVVRLTESMAAELKPHNIQVNCVLPGTIDTPENRKVMPGADFKMWVKPEKIAEVILFLSSQAADAVSGAALEVYGRS